MIPLRDLKRPQPMVFAGVYPFDAGEHAKLKSAIEKVCLNDFSVSLTTESSMAMGLGWRVGFLGLLHMEVSLPNNAQFCRNQCITDLCTNYIISGVLTKAGRRV